MSRRLRGSGVHLDVRRAEVYLDTIDDRVHVATELAYEQLAAAAEARMKTGAPWTDRTGLARQSLSASVGGSGSLFTLVLSHGMPYGFWLEVANDGDYAIVTPTFRWAQTQLPQMIAASVNRALRVG